MPGDQCLCVQEQDGCICFVCLQIAFIEWMEFLHTTNKTTARNVIQIQSIKAVELNLEMRETYPNNLEDGLGGSGLCLGGESVGYSADDDESAAQAINNQPNFVEFEKNENEKFTLRELDWWNLLEESGINYIESSSFQCQIGKQLIKPYRLISIF